MSHYYKVTRLDGCSFHTDKVKYELGKRVRPEPYDGPRQLCGPGLLHASPSAPKAARYGRWPYRLWAVEGKPHAKRDDKAGFKQLTVTAELDVAECFGPNGAKVLAVIRRAETMTEDEAIRLAAARSAARSAALDAARSAARDAAWYAAWYAARYAAWAAVWDAAGDAAWDESWDESWPAARYAARDAAGALVVDDRIGQHGFTQDYFDMLMGPWVEVMGEVTT